MSARYPIVTLTREPEICVQRYEYPSVSCVAEDDGAIAFKTCSGEILP